MKSPYYLLLLLIPSLACTDSTKTACSVDSDCRYLNSCVDTCCAHKDLTPLMPPEAGGTILIFVIAGLSNAGGIGGGPIMTSFELLLFYFDPKWAIPLSQCIITAGAVIGLGIRAFMRHPTKNRPQLDYHLSMAIIPPVLLGSTYGVMANKVLPNWLILTLLTIVLAILTVLTLKNGIGMYRAESLVKRQGGKQETVMENCALDQRQESAEARPLEIAVAEERGQLPQIQKDSNKAAVVDQEKIDIIPLEQELDNNTEGANSKTENDKNDELQRIYERESKQFPLIPIAWIFIVVVYVALGLSIRGGGGTSFAGITFCSDTFMIFFGLWSLGMFLLCFPAVFYLLNLKQKYDSLKYEYDEFDIKWTKEKCFSVWISGVIGGFGGSMLGFGACVVIAPILIQWKVRAPCIPPTVALMTAIGSAISVMQFAEQKMLVYDYAGYLSGVALIGSVVGVLSVTKIVKVLGRPSILVLVLAVVLGIAMFLVPIYTLIDIIEKQLAHKGEYGFMPYCS